MTVDDIEPQGLRTRTLLAFGVVGVATLGTIALAVTIVVTDGEDAQTVFNVAVPVVASWVSTILAFYFGRENFESANREMRQLVKELSPAERATQPATAIMRPVWNTITVVLDDDTTPETLPLADLRRRCVGNVSRLIILRPDRSALVLIHESRIDQHIADGGSEDDSLAAFLTAFAQAVPPALFDHGHGFLTAPEQATVADVKRLLDASPQAQDVLVTRSGAPDGEVLGWISNIRLARYLPV